MPYFSWLQSGCNFSAVSSVCRDFESTKGSLEDGPVFCPSLSRNLRHAGRTTSTGDSRSLDITFTRVLFSSLVSGRIKWFSPSHPVSSYTETGGEKSPSSHHNRRRQGRQPGDIHEIYIYVESRDHHNDTMPITTTTTKEKRKKEKSPRSPLSL